MIGQEIAVGCKGRRSMHLLTGNPAEILVIVLLSFVLAKGGGENDTEVIGRECDQPLVKGFVIEG